MQVTQAYKLPRGHKRPPRGSTTLERFEFYTLRSEDPDGCWMWRGGTLSEKPGREYGTFWDGSRVVLAHRWSYEHFRKPIPDGLVIDHTCETPRCVRPDHLEPVTQPVNVQRGGQWPHNPDIPRADRVNPEINRPNCPKCGTPYTTDKNGKRRCRPCSKAGHREWAIRTGRRTGEGRRRRELTVCPQGHEYTPENTYVAPKTGNRDCKICRRDRKRKESPGKTGKRCPPDCTCGRHRRRS